jgi:uncharacterized protein YndB with AHSA1/START domain
MANQSAPVASEGTATRRPAGEGPLTRSIAINAPTSKVWDALTNNIKRKQWFFGVDTKTDWKPGSSIVHTGEYEGKPYEDKGEILEIEPNRLLVHSHWSKTSGTPDRPENYQNVSFFLTEDDGKTTLTLAESNFPSDKARKMSEQAWDQALKGLKQLVEG